ncbi:alpha-glucosidase [Monaibacterium marinum]|uniref:Alpha-glucosidase n=1 Tax=Pontivivens marinum TaxID=1690039 RepID=A0A2C9CW60_9RHOB|nr:TIM-barrel domain-containing protein [Monaibacterium marinum]SOH95534.1 alpha-glucosidase [Monaibacterium marinum]
MKTLKSWTLERQRPDGVELRVEDRHILRVVALENQLFRVSLKKDGAWRLPRTWSIAPKTDVAKTDVPWEGRNRDDMSGFDSPRVTIEDGDALTLSTDTIRLTISHPLHLSWAVKVDGVWQTFVEERPTGGMLLGLRDHRHNHFLRRYPDEPVHGLGEKTGPLDRRGRHYEMRNLDAMGYDAETTDPLYKHMPLTMTQTVRSGAWSIFYDNLASCHFDLGKELDNYHLPYRAYRSDDGDLDYYLRWAPDMLDLVKGHVRLTGGTCFPPRWSLGYSGSTMSYTDAENAQEQLEGFVEKIAEHEIPCDSFQLSSGYSSINGKRYVFNWNREKVPDVKAMTGKFRDAGVHLIGNIKPCLLNDHPLYAEVAAAGLFVKDSETGAPEQSTFWDDEGSHLDFTNPDTIKWWKDGVTAQLLENGIGSTWNDNNEYEVWDREAQCAGFGEPIDIALIRPLQSVLMTRASQEAQRAHAPDKRPYLICRSGAPGIQRYAQTWSGDNRTEWKTLRYNIRTGLGMSLSGMFNVGHDVGGFSGPRPDPELFVRWVQNGIFHPRFTIHSWNDDQSANEAWMHPEVTGHIRDAINLRYRLMPYLYTLLWQAVQDDEPMLRPIFIDHPNDPHAWEETDDFMLGRDLLVANVTEQGATSRKVRLPLNATGWWDFDSGQWHAPGAVVEKVVDLATIPLFVRAGAVLPMSIDAERADPMADMGRVLALFPLQGDGSGAGYLFEDDGVSVDAPYSLLNFSLVSRGDTLELDWQQAGTANPVLDKAIVSLPKGETRSLTVRGTAVAPGNQFEL